MDRTSHASKEVDKFGAGKHGFTDGTPTDPSSGTVVDENWLDGVQEEIIGIIEAAGKTPTDADYTQLLDSLVLAIGGTMTGTLTFSLPGDDETARITEGALDDINNLRLLYESGWVRLYVDFTGLFVAYNCTYDNTANDWVADVGPTDPMVLELNAGGGGILALHRGTIVAGAFPELSKINLTMTVPGTPTANTGYAVGLSKVVGKINSATGTPQILGSSLGIATAVEVAGAVVLTFDQTFEDANYCVTATLIGSNTANHAISVDPGTSGCTVWIYDTATGAAIDMGAGNYAFCIDIKGNHA